MECMAFIPCLHSSGITKYLNSGDPSSLTMVSVKEKAFKTILNRMKHIDPWFWCRYTLNPYQGCEFSCTYCDARSHKYHLHTDFEQTILIKKDAPRILDHRISRSRTLLPDVVCMAGVCDPYQAIESRIGNTRSCLEVLERHRWPVHVITKSPAVLRDMDILHRIAMGTWAAVSFTVTTLDPTVAAFLEPKAPDPKDRIEAIRTIKETSPGVQTGVLMIPIVPFLEDDREGVERVVREAKQAKADYVLFSAGMTMRDNQALWFLRNLQEQYPDLVPKYERLYGFSNSAEEYSGSYSPEAGYVTGVSRMVREILRRNGMASRIRRYIPEDHRKENYRISERMLNMAMDSQLDGRSWKGLHWAGMNIQNLKESIVEVAARGELDTLGNIRGRTAAIIEGLLKGTGTKVQTYLTEYSR